MWLLQCSECRECSIVPLLVLPATIVSLPSISIARLVAKGALGLLSPRAGQWSAGGIGVVDRSSIHSRGRHLSTVVKWALANERGREMALRTVCFDVAPKGGRQRGGRVCREHKELVEYASSRCGLGYWR